MNGAIRARWAAIGAAVAVTLGAGGIGFAHATNPAGAATLIPITPCRISDTRPESPVGDRQGPLGGGDTMIVTTRPTGSGVTAGGQCAGLIPPGATGVSMNVTAIGATLPTFLTVWPTGAPAPNASSLNPTPGAPPTPNAVTTGLSATGQFSVFNLQGVVHVVVDVNGYYVDHHHDDRYVTRDELASRDLGHVVIGAEQFVASELHNVSYTFLRARIDGASGSAACLIAPANLPHGAAVTRIRARVVDDGALLDANIALTAYGLSSTAGEIIDTAVSTGASAALRTIVDDVDGHVVDARTRRYAIRACMPVGSELHDVIINYSVPA